MGRLFWKFFFFILLAQLTAIIGVGGALWWKHQVQDAAREARAAIGPLDTLIAAHALSLHWRLATHNVGEFRRVPGLTVEDWLA